MNPMATRAIFKQHLPQSHWPMFKTFSQKCTKFAPQNKMTTRAKINCDYLQNVKHAVALCSAKKGLIRAQIQTAQSSELRASSSHLRIELQTIEIQSIQLSNDLQTTLLQNTTVVPTKSIFLQLLSKTLTLRVHFT